MVIILNKCHYSVLSRIKEILLEISVRVGFFLSRAKKFLVISWSPMIDYVVSANEWYWNAAYI